MNTTLPSKTPHQPRPSRQLAEIALLSREERLAGRSEIV